MSAPERTVRAARVSLAGLSFALVGALLVLADRGYDTTDEGAYLNAIATPRLWEESVTLFGSVYHPLYALVGGDVASLRRLTVALTFGLAWWAAHAAIGSSARSWPRSLRTGCAAAAGVSSLRIYDQWLLTPNYNVLALQGSLVVALGTALWCDNETGSRRALGGAAALGLGGGILFLAKPTAAAATAVLVVVVLLLARRADARGVATAGATSLGTLAVASLLVDGSPLDTVTRFRDGLAGVQVLDAGYSWTTIITPDPLLLSPLAVAVWTGSVLGVGLTLRAVTDGKRWRPAVVVAVSLLVALLAVTAAARPGLWSGRSPSSALLPLSLPLCALVVVVARTRDDRQPSAPGRAALIIGLALTPWAGTVGTNGNWWVAAGQWSVFWVLAALVALRPASGGRGWAPAAVVAVTAVGLTALPLLAAAQSPYRQPGHVWAFSGDLVVGDGARLKVATGSATALDSLRAAAMAAGYQEGDAVIDLTGESPGVVFALGGTAINSPWVPGGYAGSPALLARTLDAVPCSGLAGSWLLDAPGGARSVATGFWPTVGATLSDYRVIGETTLPAEQSTAPAGLRLLRDTRSPEQAERACVAARSDR